MGIFSDLEQLGLKKFENVELYEDKKKEAEEKATTKAIVSLTEEDALFDKTFVCPVCDNEFKSKTVKTGKVKSCGHDTDLRPKYELMDPLKYDALVCDRCGYGSLSRFYGHLSSNQIKQIKANITQGFKGIDNNKVKFSYDDAILRHKLALACCIVKGSKYSERAYTCLKLAWLLRGKQEELQAGDPQIKELKADETECLSNAYEGFLQAFTKENFPMCGMDEMTLSYLISDVAFRLGKYEESLKLLARVITNKDTNRRIKDEAYELKERIKVKLENK